VALLRSAYVLTGDKHLAEDLVQTTLSRTHRAWGRLDDTSHAEAYARRVMYHAQASWWRRRRVAESLTSQPGDADGRRACVADPAWGPRRASPFTRRLRTSRHGSER
jgi:DNA-directed RNA polymerase specialized sigma24 family protein